MAEPECDDAGIDTGVEQSHRGRVPQGMGGDVFIGQARTARGGGGRAGAVSRVTYAARASNP